MEILKTSENWYKEEEFSNIVLLDPDGWDRTNYEYSFNVEKINKKTFEKRLALSTCMFKVKKEKMQV